MIRRLTTPTKIRHVKCYICDDVDIVRSPMIQINGGPKNVCCSCKIFYEGYGLEKAMNLSRQRKIARQRKERNDLLKRGREHPDGKE